MNRRISFLAQQIDLAGIDAQNNPTMVNIFSYYSFLDQLYININYLMNSIDRKDVNYWKRQFYEVYNTIQKRYSDEEDEVGMTPLEGLLMISFLKKMNNILITGLQKKGYFFSIDKSNEVDDGASKDYYDLADYYKEMTDNESKRSMG